MSITPVFALRAHNQLPFAISDGHHAMKIQFIDLPGNGQSSPYMYTSYLIAPDESWPFRVWIL